MKFDFPNEDIMVIGDYEIPGPNERNQAKGMLDTHVRWSFKHTGAQYRGSFDFSKNYHKPYTARLCFDCTNNITEYEACILGLEAAINLRIKHLEVWNQSSHKLFVGKEVSMLGVPFSLDLDDY